MSTIVASIVPKKVSEDTPPCRFRSQIAATASIIKEAIALGMRTACSVKPSGC